MDKRIFGWIMIFSLISSILLFVGVFIWGVNNDLVLYEVNEQAQSLKDSGIITNFSAAAAEEAGNSHANLNFYFDYWWLCSYIVFVLSTLFTAYFSAEEDYFSFLGLLFFGTMFVLFIIWITYPLTEWWIDELLYQIIPNIEGTMPMFDHYNDNIGMYSFLHFLAIIFANRIYFRIKDYVKKENSINQEVI
jgi:hypothetical protein